MVSSTPKRLEDLQALLRDGFEDWHQLGNVAVKRRGALVLFNYLDVRRAEWTWFEQVSRGLVLHAETTEVVARPFDKFFNWGEHGRATDAALVAVTEKLDGALGVLYRDPDDGGTPRIATRGSFDSPQALWASAFLHRSLRVRELPKALTLMFEIIAPEHRVVVDYGEREALVLIGARELDSGRCLAHDELVELAGRIGTEPVRTVAFDSPHAIVEASRALPPSHEGWVAEFADGQRFKFKGQAYLESVRVARGLNRKRVARALLDGELEALRDALPEELHDLVARLAAGLEDEIEARIEALRAIFDQGPHQAHRVVFATWVNANHRRLGRYLFALLDGRDLRRALLDELAR